MRTFATSGAVLAALTVTLPAAAQHYGAGTVILSGERLTGFNHTRASIGNADAKFDHFALLGTEPTSPADLPRIGIDGFVANHLSLGGTLMVDHRSGSIRLGRIGPIAGDVDGDETDFLIQPRIGYLLMFSRVVGFWPRGGLSYFHAGYDNASAHYIAVNIEAPFVIDFTGGFGMTIGPTLDVSIDGSYDPDNGTSTDLSYTSFGLQLGLLGWL